MSPAARLLAPRFWGVHLLALVLVGASAWPGLWQVDAWQTRRTAESIDLTAGVAEPLAAVFGPDDPFPGDKVGQPVNLSGTWLPQDTVYVDGRTGGPTGADGVWVVTPLVVTGGDAALLVVRGWAAATAAAPPAPTGTAELVGLLQPTDGSTEPDPDPADDVLPALRVADVVQRFDVDLYGGYAVVIERAEPRLTPATPEQLPPASRFTALRNLLYALEWWVFGLFAAFVWWRHLRDQVAAEALAVTADDHVVPSEP
ncbi:MAG: SURF1 family protein [Nocardioides sp.]